MSIGFASRMTPLVALTVAAALLVAVSVDPHPGLVVPIVHARALDGEELLIGAPPEGERQVLYFFTTTCPYCLESIGEIQRLAGAVAADPASALYGVAMDTLPAVRSYVEEHQLGFPVVVADRRTAALYRVRQVPQLTVVGNDGRISYTRQGVLGDPAAVDSVLAALAAPERAPETTADLPVSPQPSGGR